jgi:hypothetical protein
VAPFADEPRWLIGALQGCLSWADRRAEARDWRSGCKGLVSAAYRWGPAASQSADRATSLSAPPADITIFPSHAASRGVVAAHKSRIIIGAPPVSRVRPACQSAKCQSATARPEKRSAQVDARPILPCQGGTGRPRVVPACGGLQAHLARALIPAPGNGSEGSG